MSSEPRSDGTDGSESDGRPAGIRSTPLDSLHNVCPMSIPRPVRLLRASGSRHRRRRPPTTTSPPPTVKDSFHKRQVQRPARSARILVLAISLGGIDRRTFESRRKPLSAQPRSNRVYGSWDRGLHVTVVARVAACGRRQGTNARRSGRQPAEPFFLFPPSRRWLAEKKRRPSCPKRGRRLPLLAPAQRHNETGGWNRARGLTPTSRGR